MAPTRNDSTTLARRLFTSESVTEGHPDKIADQTSDAILDAILADDPNGRVACEVLVTTGLALVAGEVTTTTYVDIPGIVRGTIRSIGYTDSSYGIDGETCSVLVTIGRQSPDIAQGVDTGGAGDQGMMFGYAVDETPELMPAPIMFAHRLTERLATARRSGQLPWLRPDGKAQVTLEYEGDKPLRVQTVVVSAQHSPDLTIEELRAEIIDHVIEPSLPSELFDRSNCIIHVNPTGRFVVGGPHGDAGLTGRKIIVDTYGGAAPHGGGAFSGKDPSKVDRSGAYFCRYVARQAVAAGVAERIQVQVAYAIGVADPVAVTIDTFGTGDRAAALDLVRGYDFRPGAIVERLRLLRPLYRRTTNYGHFGKPDLPWEA